MVSKKWRKLPGWSARKRSPAQAGGAGVNNLPDEMFDEFVAAFREVF